MSIGNLGGGGGRKSVEEHVRDGTYRPARHGRRGRPPLKVIKIPPPPSGASPAFAAMWKRAARMLDPLKVVTELDLFAFELLVQALVVCETAFGDLHGKKSDSIESLVVVKSGPHGKNPARRPEVDTFIKAQQLAAFHLSRFGATPADRFRVEKVIALGVDGEGPSPGDPFKEFRDRET